MNEVSIAELRKAVEGLHECKAVYIGKEHVIEMYDKDIVWEGDVSIFVLVKHPKTRKAYAWSSPVEGSDKRRFYAVLEIDPVNSPLDAVRASIASDYQEGGK